MYVCIYSYLYPRSSPHLQGPPASKKFPGTQCDDQSRHKMAERTVLKEFRNSEKIFEKKLQKNKIYTNALKHIT